VNHAPSEPPVSLKEAPYNTEAADPGSAATLLPAGLAGSAGQAHGMAVAIAFLAARASFALDLNSQSRIGDKSAACVEKLWRAATENAPREVKCGSGDWQ
jgi:hypothetical protein